MTVTTSAGPSTQPGSAHQHTTTASENDPPGIVFWFSGEMTGPVAQGWEALAHRLWAGRPRAIALDLSGVTLLTCAAIRSLGCAAVEARQLGVPFELRQVPGQPARLLHWARLEHLIASYSGEQDPRDGSLRLAWSALTAARARRGPGS